MVQTAMLWPLMALVGWTIAVLMLVAFRRFHAAFQGKVSVADFTVGESVQVPAVVCIANRAFMNLTEVPVLFYAVSLVHAVLGPVAPAAVALAWVYVGLRVVHSLIYLTYNAVLHRFAAFALSNAVLTLLWAMLLPKLMG